jgi:hypothetical protein
LKVTLFISCSQFFTSKEGHSFLTQGKFRWRQILHQETLHCISVTVGSALPFVHRFGYPMPYPTIYAAYIRNVDSVCVVTGNAIANLLNRQQIYYLSVG